MGQSLQGHLGSMISPGYPLGAAFRTCYVHSGVSLAAKYGGLVGTTSSLPPELSAFDSHLSFYGALHIMFERLSLHFLNGLAEASSKSSTRSYQLSCRR
jgi:hypothetical protein